MKIDQCMSIFLVVLLLSACKQKAVVPSIPKEKFIEILADMHLAEEMVTKFRISDRDSVRNLYYSEIGTIHKIDTSEITKEIKILQSNPEYAFEIYQNVYKFLDDKSSNPKQEKK